jgi:plastocyanin
VRKLSLFLVLTLAVATGACGGDDDADTSTAADETTTTAAVDDTSAAETVTVAGEQIEVRGKADATDAIEVEVDDNYFEPNVITATAGSKVTFTLKVEGSNPHTFTVEGGPDEELAQGKDTTVEVTVPDGGVVFFCKIHGGGGMKGAIGPAF